MDKGFSERIKEQEKEIGFLRSEVARLKAELARSTGTARDLLRRRGFRVYRSCSTRGIILPRPASPESVDEYYRQLGRYSFRLFLRDVIKMAGPFVPDELVRYSSLEAVRKFCAYLEEAGILARRGKRYLLDVEDVTSFGPTLEWFVSETFRREFTADTVWGVKFKGTAAGGDYDVIAAVEGRLVYAEVKSSPPKQIYVNEVAAFIGRVSELGPELSLFIVDTELRMKDKVVALFEEALPKTRLAGSKLKRYRDELFHLDGRIFIVNSKNSLSANIGDVLGWYLRRV